MKFDQVHLIALIGASSTVAVGIVFVIALLSILIVFLMKSTFIVFIQTVTFICELITATVAAITSGTTITMSIVVAACAAAITLPASSIEARVAVSMIVSSAAIVVSAVAVLTFTTLRIDADIAFALVGAASMSVALAAAWAVGVMSLIEKETHHGGIRVTSILDTVRRNNHRMLKLMLKLQAGLKRRDLDIALLHSVKVGYKECVKVLLEAGACPDASDSYDITPLMSACETGSYEIAKLLVESGASVGLHQSGGRGTALHMAAKWGSDECVRLLLSKLSNPNDTDSSWRTPLMLAAIYAPTADTVISTLISAGSDVNATGPERKTALHFAASRGLDPTVLLGAGADACAVDATGNSPLHLAASCGHDAVVRCLLAHKRVNPDATNDRRQTPLHLAAASGNVGCLEAIVQHSGPTICSAVDANNRLPVWYAAFNGRYDATVFFIRVNGSTFVGRSATNSSSHYFRDIIRQDTSSWSFECTPLEAALERRHISVAKALLIGGHVDRCSVSDWLHDVRERSGEWVNDNLELVDWMENFALVPSELSQLCRLTVRNLLQTRVFEATPTLQLPKKLQQYVMLDELLPS